MDTRILELAEIIVERGENFMKHTNETVGKNTDEKLKDKYLTYKSCSYHAMQIIFKLEEYRQKYIDDYK